jgi:hypothetical protein
MIVKSNRNKSLMDFEPLKWLFEDKSIKFNARSVDSQWFYQRFISEKMAGFSPASEQIFTGEN